MNPSIEPVDSRAGSPQAKQLTRREHSPTHQQIKVLLSMTLPTWARPSFPPTASPSHQLHPPEGRQKKQEELQPLSLQNKTHSHRMLTEIKRQRITPRWKDKTPGKQRNGVEIGNLPEKEFKITIVQMIQDLRNRMEKMLEMFTKDLEELKHKQRWIIH